MNQIGNAPMQSTIRVRLTEEERALIEQAAQLKGQTISQFVRDTLESHVNRHKSQLK